ncbi:MAG: RNA polymerase sigma factor [Phycisphaerales bacterium]
MPDDPRTDAELLRAYVRGEASAFDVLYERHRDWAWRLSGRFSRDQSGAMDIMQEAFAYLIARAPGLELRAPLRSLLYSVIKHAALSRRRRRPFEPLIDQDTAATERAGAGDEDLRVLDSALARLPEAQREVLLMRTIDGLSLAEIAAALSIPAGTAKSRLHFALQSLREDAGLARYFSDDAAE